MKESEVTSCFRGSLSCLISRSPVWKYDDIETDRSAENSLKFSKHTQLADLEKLHITAVIFAVSDVLPLLQ